VTQCGYAVRSRDLPSSTMGDWTVGLKLELLRDHSAGWITSDIRRMRGRPDEVRRLIRDMPRQMGEL